jgi:hypothetical protein
MRIFIENPISLAGMSTPYRIWSDDGVLWKYVAQDEGWGDQYASVTVVPLSRMNGVIVFWDTDKSFGVVETSMDMIDADTIAMYAYPGQSGLVPGPLEHMLSWHFRITGPTEHGMVSELCIDTAFWPPSAHFVFSDMDGNSNITVIANGPYCVPVKAVCGNVNDDLNVDIGDGITILNSIFKSGKPLDPVDLADVNCDGAVNVGDAVYLMNYIFKFGPAPCCM